MYDAVEKLRKKLSPPVNFGIISSTSLDKTILFLWCEMTEEKNDRCGEYTAVVLLIPFCFWAVEKNDRCGEYAAVLLIVSFCKRQKSEVFNEFNIHKQNHK